MPRNCRIIIVPEDKDHAALARGYLDGRGFQPRTYRVTQHWTGKNGNYDRVREWFVEEVREQSKMRVRFGVLALTDEDGQGLSARRQRIADELARLELPALDSSQGRLLVVPVRNVETWMVWGARWEAAGAPTSSTVPPGFLEVDEAHDYKRWQAQGGHSLPHESRLDAFRLGRRVAQLNPASPPTGLPPALRAVLKPWSDFLDWARR